MSEQAPKRKKRPRDVNQLAKAIVDIATGAIDDVTVDQSKGRSTAHPKAKGSRKASAKEGRA